MGLVMFTLSMILVADLIGVIPKKDVVVLDARKKISEVLAVQLSLAISLSEPSDVVKLFDTPQLSGILHFQREC